MTKGISLAILLVLSGIGWMQLYAEDEGESLDVRGGYRECRISEYEVGSSGETNLTHTYRRYYTPAGRILSNLIFEYYENVHPSYTVAYTYDSENRLISRVESVFQSNRTVPQEEYSFAYSYGSGKDPLECVEEKGGADTGKRTVFRYDTFGRLSGISFFDAEGKEMYRQDYQYDLFGHRSETLHYSPDGKLLFTLKHKQYNRDDREGTSMYSSYGTLSTRYLRKTDMKKNALAEYEFRVTEEGDKMKETLTVFRNFSYR